MLKEHISKFKGIPICSITPFTLQDFPNFTACILWLQGCNFRCSYCYNIDLVEATMKSLSFEKIYKFLASRRNILDGIVFSGGECTLYKNFIDLVKLVKELGFKIKVDTNGSSPKVLEKLLKDKLIDYVAIDYKAPLKKYKAITNYSKSENIQKSLRVLGNSKIDFEVRTTVHTSLINEEDINLIINDLDEKNYKGNYFIQNFKNGPTINNLPSQERILDKTRLRCSNKFEVKFRNF